MNETLNQIMERSGEMWANGPFDRTQVPVLVRLNSSEDEAVYELWLEPKALPPQWTARERTLTDAEALEVYEAKRDARMQHSVHLDAAVTTYEGFAPRAWIKNGRSAKWLPHVMKARVTVVWEPWPELPRRQVDQSAQSPFDASGDSSECPYNRHVRGAPLPDGAPFVDDPRTHADVVRRLDETTT